MEVTKDLQKNCAGVIVTLSQSNADYTVALNRESKHNRGLLRTNSQIQVANRLGDILGTNATRTVGNAAKDACKFIVADWSQHGRMAVPDPPAPAPVAAPIAPATAPAPAGRAKIETVSEVQPPPAAASTGGTAAKAEDGGRSSGEAETNESSPVRMGEATVQISSDPSGADIEVDGGFVGSTPSSVGIATGEHTVRVSKNGYKRWERTLRTSTGSIKIAAVLEPIPVASVGTAHPAAEIADTGSSPANQSLPSRPGTVLSKDDGPGTATRSTVRTLEAVTSSSTAPPEGNLIGVSFAGNPTVRHDGVEISAVHPKGPADSIEIKSGDVILAINAHYLFTIDELRAELQRYKPGARVLIRYRRNQFISENYLTLRAEDAFPRK